MFAGYLPFSSQSKLYSLFYILISVDWSITSWKVDHNHLSYVPGTLSFLITLEITKKNSTQQTNPSQVQWSQGPSPRWRGRAQSEKSNCRQKRSGSVSTLQWTTSNTNNNNNNNSTTTNNKDKALTTSSTREGRRGPDGKVGFKDLFVPTILIIKRLPRWLTRGTDHFHTRFARRGLRGDR